MIGSMIEIRIREVAEKRGITNAYQLQKATGLSASMAARLYKDDVEMIALRTLDALCSALKCKPNDIIRFTPE